MTAEQVDLDEVAEKVGWHYIIWVLSQHDEYAVEIMSELLGRVDIKNIRKEVTKIIEKEIFKIK